jgi:hypothetical protein
VANSLTTWESWMSYLKSQSSLVALLENNSQIKESQWQGEVFSYPAVRLYIDYHPSLEGCGPDNFDAYIDIFSEEKSSKEAQQIASVLEGILQKRPFEQNGIKVFMVWVKNVIHPKRDIYAWKSCLEIKGMVSS